MPDEQELEQLITDHIDQESLQQAVLKLEIEKIREAIKKAKAVAKN